MKTPSKTFAVILAGHKKPIYFEADSWQVNDYALRLIRGVNAIALFSMRNLSALIELSAGAHITDAKAKENLKSGPDKPGISLDLSVLSGEMK
jgi:hypothetical protein